MSGGIQVPSQAYATLEDVGILLPGRVYDQTSRPTAAQCEHYIKSIASELNARLRGLGYEPPLTDTDDILILARINALGAAIIIESATLGTVQGDSPLIETLRAEYQQALKDLTAGSLVFEGAGESPVSDADGPDDLDASGARADPVFVNSTAGRGKQF